MRALWLLALTASCSNSPITPARADAAQGVSAPPAAQPAPTVTPPTPPMPAEPKFRYSKLMGVRLVPADQVRDAPGDMVKGHDEEIAGAKIVRACGKREDYFIESLPRFREVNLMMGAFVKDAQDIGWKLTLRKGFVDALVYDGSWHGVKADVMMMPIPDGLYLSICMAGPPVAPASAAPASTTTAPAKR